ncbi:MAG: HAD family phosphatase [Ilumatobacteraceae bacterium]
MRRVVLFDLGGVIVDLGGLEDFLDRHDLDPSEFWPAWLELGAGHRFESGQSTPDEFARAFLEQFDVDLSPEMFLEEFAAWPSGLLPGAAELVDELRSAGITTATLSNTNPIHWASPFNQTVIVPMFDRHFPSFELGLAKPVPAIFELVVEMLTGDPGEITFLDDNQVNVEAARRVGLAAFHVRGPAEARRALFPPR